MRDEYLELLGSPEDTHALLQSLVHACGCGCSFENNDVWATSAESCAAVRALRDRRFVLGLLFARHLREEFIMQEWQADPPAAG